MRKTPQKKQRHQGAGLDKSPATPDDSFFFLSSAKKKIRNSRYSKYLIPGAVSVLTFLVYLASLRNEFVLWDDPCYVSENAHIRSLDAGFFKWSFLDLSGNCSGSWHPLTWISHALDYAIWGLNPLGHHLTNNILHAVNTFLVALLISRLIDIHTNRSLKGDPQDRPHDSQSTIHDSRFKVIAAAVTGLLFGLHPLHVESVAWASERKDLLCALFFLMSIMSYTKYAERKEQRAESGQTKKNNSMRFAPGSMLFFSGPMLYALCFFVLALLSKAMAVTLPLVLLILDWYPLGRIKSLKSLWILCVEKVPFFVLSLLLSLITVTAQKSGGALSEIAMAMTPLPQRVLLAAKSLVLYLWKIIWPLDLIPLYPYPNTIDPFSLEYTLPLFLIIAITAACGLLARKRKFYLAAWGYYVVTLIPVLGLVQVGIQSMADRYTYLPSIGPFLLVGLTVSSLYGRISALKGGAALLRIGGSAAALMLFVSMAYLTFEQIGIWKNGFVMWDYVIEKRPREIPLAYGNRGVCFADAGDLDRALEDYNTAIALDRFYTGIYFERGLVLARMNQFEKAISDYDQAIKLDQIGAKSDVGRELYFLNRGIAYYQIYKYDLAVSDFRQACDLGNSKGCEFLNAVVNERSNGNM